MTQHKLWMYLSLMLVLCLGTTWCLMDRSGPAVARAVTHIVANVHERFPTMDYASFGRGYRDDITPTEDASAPVGVSYRLSSESGGRRYWITAQGVSPDACMYLLSHKLYSWDAHAVRVNGMVLWDAAHTIRAIDVDSVCSHAETPGIAISWLLG